MTSKSGWKIDNQLILDAQICIGGNESVWVEDVSLSRASDELIFTLYSENGFWGSFSLKNGVFKNIVTGSGGEYRGIIVSSGEVPSIPNSVQSFDSSALVFDASVLYSLPSNCLETISINGTTLRGRVYFVEGDGVRIVKTGINSFRFDLVGSPIEENANCYPSGTALKGLNVSDGNGGGYTILPDKYGNMSLIAAHVPPPETDSDLVQSLKISPDNFSGIKISIIK